MHRLAASGRLAPPRPSWVGSQLPHFQSRGALLGTTCPVAKICLAERVTRGTAGAIARAACGACGLDVVRTR